jgi:hypothetical protein
MVGLYLEKDCKSFTKSTLGHVLEWFPEQQNSYVLQAEEKCALLERAAMLYGAKSLSSQKTCFL